VSSNTAPVRRPRRPPRAPLCHAAAGQHPHVTVHEELEGYGRETCLICDATPATIRVRWHQNAETGGARALGRSEAYYYCEGHRHEARKMQAKLVQRS
jgi:hypothetical protein